MSEIIIGVITQVEDDEYPIGKTFKKVTLGTGQVLKVKHGAGDELMDKWALLQQGVAIKFTMGEFNGRPFVQDIETVEGELPPETEPTVFKALQEVIDHDKAEAKAHDLPPPAPQAVGMMTKEIGDMLRWGARQGRMLEILEDIYGEPVAREILKWYRSQGLGITRVPYDGKTLPDFNN